MARISFFSVIESLQKKPERVRRRALVIMMIIVMVAVLAGWARSFTTTIGRSDVSINDFKQILDYGQGSE